MKTVQEYMLLFPVYAFSVSSDLKPDVDALSFTLKYEELKAFTPLPSLSKLPFFQRKEQLQLLCRLRLLCGLYLYLQDEPSLQRTIKINISFRLLITLSGCLTGFSNNFHWYLMSQSLIHLPLRCMFVVVEGVLMWGFSFFQFLFFGWHVAGILDLSCSWVLNFWCASGLCHFSAFKCFI